MGDSKRRKQLDPNYGVSKFAYSNEVLRISDAEVALLNLELKDRGWSEKTIKAANALREAGRGEDILQRIWGKELQQWVDSAKSLEALSSFSYSGKFPCIWRDRIECHARSLLRMSIHLDPLNSDSSAFLGETKPDVQRIGRDLNDWGGTALMFAIAEIIPKGFQRELDYAWDGIGGWKS